MNISTRFIIVNGGTKILQMDKALPRGVLGSLKTCLAMTIPLPTSLPLRYSCSSSAAFASFNLSRPYPFCTLSTTTDFSHPFVKASNSFSESIMGKNQQGAFLSFLLLLLVMFVSCLHFSWALFFSELNGYEIVREVAEEAKKDQQREAYGQASGDYSKRGADDILPHVLNIYGSRASPQDFEIYAPNATFEDPLMRAEGVKQIKSAFYSLGKVFSESRIVEYSIKEDVISTGKEEISIDNKQYYKFLGKEIHMISLIKLHMENGKIGRHEDWWDKKPLWNRETAKLPLIGRMAEMTRRASMLATHALMGFGKDPTK